MIDSQLIELVKTEAKNLKQHAYQEELGRLDFRNLYPNSTDRCIYGQMTGDCNSPRANDLIEMCAERVYPGRIDSLSETPIPPAETTRENYWSPIEKFISLNEFDMANNRALIDYLKDITQTLIFQQEND